MKLLITGATGFIGGRLLKSFVDIYGNDSVYAFVSKEIAGVNCIVYKNASNFELDDFNFSAFTHIVHAGAFIPKDRAQENDINSCESNIIFTNNLLRLDFKRLIRIINLSTIDVYDNNDLISESSEINPVSLYGASKYYCESVIKSFAKCKGLEYINLRIGHVYGPGEEKYRKVLPLTMDKILTDDVVEIWGDGSELRSFIYINDVVESIIKSLDCALANIDVNVVSGMPVTIKDLIFKVIKISDKDVSLKYIESNHVKRNLVFDNSRVIKLLLNKETDLDYGLSEEYLYLKNRYENNL
jgi:UDP-glucose 4-epimerase